MEKASYFCPCCGYQVFDEPPGSYEICPICYWEDDVSQLRFFAAASGANKFSLCESQENYAKLGACEARFLPNVRPANKTDLRDPQWRPVNLARDRQEQLIPGKDYGSTYPRDLTALYYWKK